jgi:hypothetical protein
MSGFAQSRRRITKHRRSAAKQKGAALLLFVALLVIGLLALFAGGMNAGRAELERDRITADALAKAKEALIGWSVSQGTLVGTSRPGELPCPDTNNDGSAEGTCAAGRLGRVPWKTLGIPEPKDSYGETLWYAVAGPFRIYNANSNPINSDTKGNITIFANDGVSKLNSEAVAVLFSPGPTINSQSRSSTITALCPTTGTTILQDRCAANYLDATNGINNAVTNGPFIKGSRSENFNDTLLYIATTDLIPPIEQRVAAELKVQLSAYYAANGYYPFAAKFDDTTGNCAMNLTRGRIPLSVGGLAPTPPNMICSGLADWTGSLPNWFMVNKWFNVIYYSVSPGYKFGGTGTCAGGCLAVGANNNIRALFFMPGTPIGAASRPSNSLTDYLEDPQNQMGWSAGANDTYAAPTSLANDRDRLIQLP